MVEGSEMPPVLRRLLCVGGGGVQAGAPGARGPAPPLGSLLAGVSSWDSVILVLSRELALSFHTQCGPGW